MTYRSMQTRLLLFICLCLLVAAIGLRECGVAHAQSCPREPVPASQWTDLAGVSLSRMVRHESHSGGDAIAIAFVMARRYYAHHCTKRSFAESIIATSRFLRRDRAQIYREVASGERRDPVMRDLLDRWARGELADVCAGPAMQWRSPGVGGPGRHVRCLDTANVFFEHKRSSMARTIEAIARGREVCR